jgi:hypothetical protein
LEEEDQDEEEEEDKEDGDFEIKREDRLLLFNLHRLSQSKCQKLLLQNHRQN